MAGSWQHCASYDSIEFGELGLDRQTKCDPAATWCDLKCGDSAMSDEDRMADRA